MAGNHGRAGVAPLENGGARVEAEAASGLVGVTAVAVLGENGADFLGEELSGIFSSGGGGELFGGKGGGAGGRGRFLLGVDGGDNGQQHNGCGEC